MISERVVDLELETNGLLYNKRMIESLLSKLPKELVIEILLFEGRIMRAYLRDYIGEVYSKVYKRYFGHRHSLKYVTGGFSGRDLLSALPFYAAWSTVIRTRQPKFLRKRKCKKHMLKYGDIIPLVRLAKERKKLERTLAHYFTVGSYWQDRSSILRHMGNHPEWVALARETIPGGGSAMSANDIIEALHPFPNLNPVQNLARFLHGI